MTIGPSRQTDYPRIFKDTKWDRNSRSDDFFLCNNMNKFAKEFDLQKHMPLTGRQAAILHQKWEYYADHLDRFRCKDGRIVVITSPYPGRRPELKSHGRTSNIPGLDRYIDLYYEKAETYIMVFDNAGMFRNYLK
jgi:hypothetical protein